MPRVPIFRGGQGRAAAPPDVRQRGGPAAGLEPLESGLSAREQELQVRQEEAEYLAARNRAEDLERQVFDPERGFLASNGREAAERRATAMADYEAGMEEIGAGFSSDRLKDLWAATSLDRRAAMRASLVEEGGRQTAAWVREERSRLLDQHAAAALRGDQDSEGAAAHLEMLAFEAEGLAGAMGLAGAEGERFVREQLARVHRSVFEGLLERGRPEDAQSYLDANAEDFSEEELALGRRRIADEDRLARGKRLGDSLIEASRMTVPAEHRADPARWLAGALAGLDSVRDPALRTIARRRIEAARRAARDPALREERERVEGDALSAIAQGNNPDDLPPATRSALGADALARLREIYDSPEARRSDWALYGRLSALSPEELADTDLFAFAGRLARSEWHLLKDRQRLARLEVREDAPKGEPHRPFAVLRRRQALYARLGLEPTRDAEEIGRLSAEIDQALRLAARAKGEPLTLAEENRLLRDAALGLDDITAAASRGEPPPGASSEGPEQGKEEDDG